MKLFDMMKNTRFTLLQGDNVEIRGMTIDSRLVTRGDVFFCIHGLHTNGHHFIETVARMGAAAVVVDEAQPFYPQNLTVLKVEGTRETLAYAAANFFGNPTESFQLVGVTGTNGKTSTTHFMEAVFNEWGKKTGIIGTVETRIGKQNVNIHFATSTTPDTIELFKILAKMRDERVACVAMEVTSHALALHKVDGIRFDTGVFTNITQDHLDFHKTMDEYRQTKAKLFENCGTGVFNADDPASGFMMKNATCRCMTYSIDNDSDLKAENVKLTALGVDFDVVIHGASVHFHAPVPGKFTVYNILAAIGAALSFGVPVETIRRGLENVQGVPGRIQRVPNAKGLNVIVDYAHTPDGLENIIKAVRAFTSGRVITVFGCGGDRDRTKRAVMGSIAGRLSDYCIITSDNPRTENPAAIMAEIEPGVRETGCAYEKMEDRREAIFRAVGMTLPEDTVIIAGKGHESYQIFADQTVDFDDCETALEAINSRREG